MAKRREEVENPMLTPVIPLKRPEEYKATRIGTRCETCNERIYPLLDSYLIVDDMYFCCDEHAADHYMKAAGGRRVYGGAC